jgi:hypothetical protein
MQKLLFHQRLADPKGIAAGDPKPVLVLVLGAAVTLPKPPLPIVDACPNGVGCPSAAGEPKPVPAGAGAALNPNNAGSKLYFFARFRSMCSSLPAYFVSTLSIPDSFEGFRC